MDDSNCNLKPVTKAGFMVPNVYPYSSEYVWRKNAHAGENQIQVISLNAADLDNWKRKPFSELVGYLRSTLACGGEDAFCGGILKVETGSPYSLTTKTVIEEFIRSHRIDTCFEMTATRTGSHAKTVHSKPSGFVYKKTRVPLDKACSVKEFFDADTNTEKKGNLEDKDVPLLGDNFFDHADKYTTRDVNLFAHSLCVPEVAGSLDLANLDTMMDVIRCSEAVHGITTNFVSLSNSLSGYQRNCGERSMYSINVAMHGKGKLWLSIAADHAQRYIDVLKEIVHFRGQKAKRENSKDDCSDNLILRECFVHPRELISHGIPFSWTVQKPGDIIITSPFSVYVWVDLGDGIHQAANFCTVDWIEYAIFSPPDFSSAEQKIEPFSFDFRTVYKLLNDEKYVPFIRENLKLVNPKKPLEGYQAAPVGPFKSFRACLDRFTSLMTEYRKKDDEVKGFNKELNLVMLEMYRFTVDNSWTHRRVFDKYDDILDLMMQNRNHKTLVSSGFGILCNLALHSHYLMKTLGDQEIHNLLVLAESLYASYCKHAWTGDSPTSGGDKTARTSSSIECAANTGLSFLMLKFFTIAKEMNLLPFKLTPIRAPKSLMSEITRMDERGPLQLDLSLRGLADEAAKLIQGSALEARLLGAFNICHFLNTSCSLVREYTIRYITTSNLLAVVDKLLEENDPNLSRYLLPVRWEVSYWIMLRDQQKLRDLDYEMRFIKFWHPTEDVSNNDTGRECVNQLMDVDVAKMWWDDENLFLEWDAQLIPDEKEGPSEGEQRPVKEVFDKLRDLPADYDHVVAKFVGLRKEVVQNNEAADSSSKTKTPKYIRYQSGHRICPHATCNAIFDEGPALITHMECDRHFTEQTIISVARTVGWEVFSTLH